MSNLWGDATMVGSRPRTSADGTDLTDYEIGAATTKFGVDMIMADIKHDGTPNTTVGITVDVTCRAGKITGYPRPNQFLYNKVSKGQALQVEGVVRVGGCGGELYRPFMVAPRTPHMQKIWTVNRDCCLMQKDLSRKGTECAEVAYAIHEFQVKQGGAEVDLSSSCARRGHGRSSTALSRSRRSHRARYRHVLFGRTRPVRS